MKINVELTSWFKRFTDGKTELCVEVPETSTAIEAVAATGVPIEEVGFITSNGIRIDETASLKNEDKIKIFTSIFGG